MLHKQCLKGAKVALMYCIILLSKLTLFAKFNPEITFSEDTLNYKNLMANVLHK